MKHPRCMNTSSSRPQLLSKCLRQWRVEDTMLEDRSSWEDKPLHGMYHWTITEVADIKKSYQWLERAGLQDSTEALILAAQEQALSTRAIEAQIYHTRQDPRCRLCKEVACTNWKRTLIALRQNEPYPDPMSFKDNWVHKFDRFQLLKHYSMPERKVRLQYTKFLFVRDPFVRLISAYRDKMQHYDQYFYEGYIRVILQRYKNQKDVPVKYNGTKKTYLKPSFHNFVQYIVDPRSEKYAPFEPHWRQMHRLCHPCLVEYDFVGHQESLQEDLLKILKLENAITFPPSYENMTFGNSVMEWFQGVSIEDRRKLYKIYEKDFQLFGYRRPTELLDD
uniref:Carbohydrate sulfotransferase n=1 Tax=Oryzias latipes TaxID=8090 RepID=A0A3B3HR86_ORYLA